MRLGGLTLKGEQSFLGWSGTKGLNQIFGGPSRREGAEKSKITHHEQIPPTNKNDTSLSEELFQSADVC